jgi:tRNA(Ile)-lysidine synthase
MKHLDVFYHQLDRYDFAKFSKVIVGLSGGSDSLALTLAAKSYLAEKHPACELIAVTVDHGLRAESHAEAIKVGQICQTHDIHHEIAPWEGEKPQAGIQQKAREARYRLLSAAAQRHNTTLVLIAHNKGDDLETKAMRAQRQNENETAHGISEATLYRCETWFVRPFLNLDKAVLQDFLQANNVTWIEDPSNKDRRFERVRARQDMSDIVSSDHWQMSDSYPEKEVCAFLADENNVAFDDGDRRIVVQNFSAENAVHHEALRVLLSLVGATAYLPSQSAVREAVANLYQFSDNGRKFTLNGCLMTKDRGGIALQCEARNRRDGQFGFDHILTSRYYEIASVLRERRGLSRLPPLPMR